MVKFLEVDGGYFILSSEVVEIRSSDGHKNQVTTKRGHTYILRGYAGSIASEIECNSGPAVTAEFGYFVVCAYPPSEANEEWETRLFPIVGWTATEHDGEDDQDQEVLFQSFPIVSGVNDLRSDWAVVWPDGKVVEPLGDKFNSIEEWLGNVRREYEDL